MKYVIVKKKHKNGKFITKGLNTKEEYLCELPLETGILFISPKKMISLKTIRSNFSSDLSKKKILKLGNYVVQELNKKN